jgi:hypothetical protein
MLQQLLEQLNTAEACAALSGAVVLLVFGLFLTDGWSTEKRQKEFFRSS